MTGTFARRSSYGADSPVVGARGARTRQQILDTALDRFTSQGFHGTSMDDIAAGADTSRATLYQYFESKDAIFIELMESAGAALMRLTRRLSSLGPTEAGFDNLHWWLGEWAWVFDRYSALFIQWANVNSPTNSMRPKMIVFLEAHNGKLCRVLEGGGVTPPEARLWADFINALASRFHYIRHVYRPGVPDAAMLDSLVTALQLAIFPTTPREVIIAGPRTADRTLHPRTDSPSVDAIGPLSTLPDADQIVTVDIFAGLSPQASRTVRRLLDSAAAVFADVGFDVANVDLIVTAAGVARGTFYRYFDDKLQVLTVLGKDCGEAMSAMFRELASFGEQMDGDTLRSWLRRYNELHVRYAGVLRAWTEGVPVAPTILAPTRMIVTEIGATIRALFGPRREYTLDRRAVGVMLAAVLENYPNEGVGTSYQPTKEELVETEAKFIERVLLAR